MNLNTYPPFISIVIVTWNSEAHLSKCLESLSWQTYSSFEIVAVDNGSNDSSISILEKNDHGLDIKIKKLDSNHGFAAANNIGIKLAQGKWVALLNADAFPSPDWLEQLIQAQQSHPEYSFFASRLIQASATNLLDGEGDAYHVSGLAWRKNYNAPLTNGRELGEVFSACAAAALYDKDAVLQVGGFDEDYFSYFEDVDLGFRLRLDGKRCLFVPTAVVYHVGSASTGKESAFSVYHGYRNLIWTFHKNMPLSLFIIYFPIHVGMIFFMLFQYSRRKKGSVFLRAIGDGIKGYPDVLRKRRFIQKNKRIRIQNISRVMSMGIPEPFQAYLMRIKNR